MASSTSTAAPTASRARPDWTATRSRPDEEDLGVRYVQHYFAIPSGQRRALQVAWETPGVWEGNSSGGVYRMTFGEPDHGATRPD